MPRIKTSNIKKGDQFRSGGRGWDALDDASASIPRVLIDTMRSDEVAIRVKHVPDGGIDFRVFHEDGMINVIREEPKTEAEKLYDVVFKADVQKAIDELEGKGYRDVFTRTADDHLRHVLQGVKFPQARHDGEQI